MSEKSKQHVTIPTAFKNVVDNSPDKLRYPLQAVRAVPSTTGRAIIEATDARMLAIREVNAQIDSACLIPAGVLCDEQERKQKLQSVAVEDGKCASGSAVFNLVTEGRYPRTPDVVPFARGTLRSVAIDARLLLALARAINDDEPAVTLMIDDKDSAICVVGEHGIGLLLLRDRSESDIDSDRMKFNRLRKAHSDAVKSTEPKAAKRTMARKVKAALAGETKP